MTPETKKLLPFMERRRRNKRPRILLLLGLIIIAMPFANYTGLALKYHIAFYHPLLLLKTITISELIFLVSSFFTGLGLLLIKRWGWWLFALASTVFVGRNITVFILYPHTASYGPLLYTILVAASMAYFFQKDIFMPYLMIHRKGWRFQKRYPLQMDVVVNGEVRRALNCSAGGLYVLWTDCSLSPGTEVSISFEIEGERFQCMGGIASINEGHGAGIAFRNMNEDTRFHLKQACHKAWGNRKKRS